MRFPSNAERYQGKFNNLILEKDVELEFNILFPLN
jgi:hypothetical protein